MDLERPFDKIHQTDKITDTKGLNGFSQKAIPLGVGYGEKLGHFAQSRIFRVSLRWFEHLVRIPPRTRL